MSHISLQVSHVSLVTTRGLRIRDTAEEAEAEETIRTESASLVQCLLTRDPVSASVACASCQRRAPREESQTTSHAASERALLECEC
eukprot:2721768-Rhodomonas_salina.1